VTNKILRGIGWLLSFLIVQVGIATVLKIAAAYPHWRVDGMVLTAALPVSLDLDAGEHEIVVAFDTDNGSGVGFHFSFEVPEAERPKVGAPRFPVVIQ